MPDGKLYVFTAGAGAAREHLDDSIKNPISWSKIEQLWQGDTADSLSQINEEAGLYAWGAVPGKRNIPNWQSMEVGDWVLCVYENTYHYVAQVVAKHQNREAAKAIWGVGPDGDTLEYMYFLTRPAKVEVPLSNVEDYLSRKYQGFTPISDQKIERIESEFGSVTNFVSRYFTSRVSASDSFRETMRRYKQLGVVYQSIVQGQQYFVSEVDDTRASVERIDANAEQRVTYASYETAIDTVRKAGGSIPFSDAHSTVAVKTSWLHGSHFWLTEDHNNLRLLNTLVDAEQALKEAIARLRVDRGKGDTKLYKPATIEAVIRGIEDRTFTKNEFVFEDLKAHVLEVFKSRGIDGGTQQIVMPYFHLTSDLFWMLAYHNPKTPIRSTPSQQQLLQDVKFATLTDAFWDVLQTPEARGRVLKHIEDTWYLPMQYFLIRSNHDTSYGDQLGKRYAYHNRVPNSRRIFTGGKVIVDRKMFDQVAFLGYGELEQGEDLGLGEDGNTQFANEYSAWKPAEPEKPLTDELKDLIQGNENYNVQHAIRPIDKPTFDAIAKYIDPGYESEGTATPPGENMPAHPLNQILFGPPGTGKTYITKEKAVAIADPYGYQSIQNLPSEHGEIRNRLASRYQELVSAGRIVFTTFHQSFGYEDFIEGIRADIDEGTKSLRYDIEPGIFKEIVSHARGSGSARSVEGLAEKPNIWKISIGRKSQKEIRQYCFDNNQARIGWNKLGDLSIDLEDRSDEEQAYWQGLGAANQSSVDGFAEGVQLGDVFLCFKDRETIQAVGVVVSDCYFDDSLAGKIEPAYAQVRDVNWLFSDLDLNILSINEDKYLGRKTFSQLKRINWTELVVLLEKNGLSVGGGEAKKDNYVLIIDEINRGNISRIFGELITLLEPSKRIGGHDEREAVLPYSKKSFAIPDNLYVVGTMNTADKSLTQMDIALRRRFTFIEMPPRSDVLAGTLVHGVDLGDLLSTINQRIEVLLDRDHLIGHSYFMGILDAENPESREAMLASVFRQAIFPLLQEYFFEDWERIGWVLNDDDKAESDRFIRFGGETALSELFSQSARDQLIDRRYWINEAAFKLPLAYQGIL